MSDLIERLEAILSLYTQGTVGHKKAIEDAITALREQEASVIHEKWRSAMARIEELELGRDEEIEGLNELIERSIKREDIAKAKIEQYEQVLESVLSYHEDDEEFCENLTKDINRIRGNDD